MSHTTGEFLGWRMEAGLRLRGRDVGDGLGPAMALPPKLSMLAIALRQNALWTVGPGMVSTAAFIPAIGGSSGRSFAGWSSSPY